jgi:hypothetical protein
MAIEKNQIYQTPSGKFLKVSEIKESGFHHFKEIDKEGNHIEEKRNTFGVVVHRTDLVYSEETIRSFKKQKSC